MAWHVFIFTLFLSSALARAEAPASADCGKQYQKISWFRPVSSSEEEELARVKWDEIFSREPFAKEGHPPALQLTKKNEALFYNHFKRLMAAEAKSGTLPAYTQADWLDFMKKKYPSTEGKGGFPHGWLFENAEKIYSDYLLKGKTLQDFYHDQWMAWYESVGHQVNGVEHALNMARENNNIVHKVDRQARRMGDYVSGVMRASPQTLVTGVTAGVTIEVGKDTIVKGVKEGYGWGADKAQQLYSVGKLWLNYDALQKMRAAYQAVDLEMGEWKSTAFNRMEKRTDIQKGFRDVDSVLRKRVPEIHPLVQEVAPNYEKELLAELNSNLPLIDGKKANIAAQLKIIEDKQKEADEATKTKKLVPPDVMNEILTAQMNIQSTYGELATILAPWLMFRYIHPDFFDNPKFPDDMRTAFKTYQNAYGQFMEQASDVDALKSETIKRLEKYMKIPEKYGLISTALKSKESESVVSSAAVPPALGPNPSAVRPKTPATGAAPGNPAEGVVAPINQ